MLAIDVGNTHITCALIEGADVRLTRRVPTETCLAHNALLDHLDPGSFPVPDHIAVSSVRRDVTGIICRDYQRRHGITPFVVTNDTPMGIRNSYRSIDTLGTDRLVDAAACYHLYTRGKAPGIVIDMGTATTVDCITEEGEFLGGAIVPGLVSAYRGLLTSAPELPEIEISPVAELIGTTTKDCIRSGVVAGHAALIRELSSMMAEGLGKRPVVVVTGGLARVIDPLLPGEYIRDEHLTLKGLSIVYSINVNNN
ncbi:MAG TPA: type III pantothenate kinase [Deltaproteobacteria bacterium]|jgi:type III pantothenate kinase|nr:type III pantothenate kinase [Deltaproteobacteria bacterium]HOI08028.1 type III pantothenate kinase [Deltaproteobacteria bacterium]